jgi:hypothetical protein
MKRWTEPGSLRRATHGAVLLLALVAVSAPARAAGEGPAVDPVEISPFQSPASREHYLRVWEPRIDAALARADTLALPPEPFLPEDIKDPVFAYLIGLLDRRTDGLVTGGHLQAILDSSGKKSRVPCYRIANVQSVAENPGFVSWARAEFIEQLRVSVPYSILGYHPGRLVSSQSVTARQWRLPRVFAPNPGKEGPHTLELEDVTLLAVVEGYIELDIDGWLDALMGGALDDTKMVGLAIFTYDGARYGMALGYNRDGEPRSGALHLGEDEVAFPTPEALKAVARHLRKLVIRRLGEMRLPLWMPRD